MTHHKGFLDVKRCCGGLRISWWFGQRSTFITSLSVAAFLRRAGGSTLARTGNQGSGVERRVPEMSRTNKHQPECVAVSAVYDSDWKWDSWTSCRVSSTPCDISCPALYYSKPKNNYNNDVGLYMQMYQFLDKRHVFHAQPNSTDIVTTLCNRVNQIKTEVTSVFFSCIS